MLVKLTTDEDEAEESDQRKREKRERKCTTVRAKRNHENETKFKEFGKITSSHFGAKLSSLKIWTFLVIQFKKTVYVLICE